MWSEYPILSHGVWFAAFPSCSASILLDLQREHPAVHLVVELNSFSEYLNILITQAALYITHDMFYNTSLHFQNHTSVFDDC